MICCKKNYSNYELKQGKMYSNQIVITKNSDLFSPKKKLQILFLKFTKSLKCEIFSSPLFIFVGLSCALSYCHVYHSSPFSCACISPKSVSPLNQQLPVMFTAKKYIWGLSIQRKWRNRDICTKESYILWPLSHLQE